MSADPWAKYPSRDPTQPKPSPPERDWTKAPWGDVAMSALKRLGPSYVEDMWNGIKGLPEVGKQVFGELQGHPSSSPAIRAAMGVARDVIGIPNYAYTPAAQARDMATAIGGLNNSLYSRYVAPGALKRTLATDPGSALMDAQALATIPEGGEGLATRIPGVAGDLAQGAVRTARTFNRITNPVSLAGEGIAAGSRAAQRAIRGGSPFDASGNFTARARAAVATAFPNGEITPAELANPKFKAALADTFQKKGINPAAVKETVLSYNGAPTPTSVITRQRPPRAAASAVGDAIADGKRAIAAKAASVAGAPGPDPSALAGALEDAHAASLESAGNKYEALRKVPGSFGPILDSYPLNEAIGSALSAKGFPSTPELLDRSRTSYPNAHEAWSLLTDALANGNTRLGGEITAPELMELRRQLTTLGKTAKGSDSAAVGQIIDGFQNHIEGLADSGLFRDQAGMPIRGFAEGLKDANANYKAHFDTFGNAKGPSGAIKRAVGILTSGTSTPDLQMAAQKGLNQKLFSPTEGPATYDALNSALGGPGSPGAKILDDHVRQTILQTGDDGNLVAKPAKIRAFLDSPLSKVFSPEEQSDLRLATAGQDVLSTKMPYESPRPTTGDFVGRGLRAGLGAAAGATTAHFLPIAGSIPGIPEVGGMIAGSIAEQTLEPMAIGQQIRHQMRGAPAQAAVLDLPDIGGRKVAAGARALPAMRALEGMGASEPPPTDAGEHPSHDIDLSTIPGPFDEPPQPDSAPQVHGADPWAAYPSAPRPEGSGAGHDIDLSVVPGPLDVPARHDDDPWAQYSTTPPSEADGGRVGRATGGRVDPEIERLVRRLTNLAKVAKRQSNKATEPLLKAPDAMVVKALEVAQRAI